MSLATFGQSIWTGWKRRWQRGLSASLIALGAVWTITEVLTRVSDSADALIDEYGFYYLTGALSLSAFAFLVTAFEARKVSFFISNTDSRITFEFADLFSQEADWLIGVNEFFDSALGQVVSPRSIHGQVISRIFDGDEAEFRAAVDRALVGHIGVVEQRDEGQNRRYDLGTTIALPRSSNKIFLVAIAKTDTATNRASSTVPILWLALAEALRIIDLKGNGRPLAMPLIGNGRASVPVPPQHLVRLITLIVLESIKQHSLPKDIKIVLADDCFKHIDLIELKRGWSFG